jgi:hypothetical protein
MVDRYTKLVLTLIACALVYLCVVFTPLPGVHAQRPSLTPGEPSGPTEVVIVGWQSRQGIQPFPVSIGHPVEVRASQPLPVRGEITTERTSTGLADRVVIVGWEEGARREKPSTMRVITAKESGIPVRVIQ